MKGIGGEDVERIPSSHGDDLSCVDCHTHACAPDLKTCSACHESSIIDETKSVQATVSMTLERLKGTLRQLERIINRYESIEIQDDESMIKEAIRLYSLSRGNYESIVKDSSRGIHNFEYTQLLLKLSIESADRAIAIFSKSHQISMSLL